MVLFFTLQDAEGTMQLSESVRTWLADHGIFMESHELRSNIHIPEYFLLGLSVVAFGYCRDWKVAVCVLICCLFGLFDEGIKILLPSREFDAIDLVKDWIGAGFAAAVWVAAINLARRLKRKYGYSD